MVLRLPSLAWFGATLALGGSFVQAQSTERVSVDSFGTQGNDDCSLPAAISPDGRYVVFASLASNLVPNDTNGFRDVFLHDRVTGTTERVNVSSSGAEANSGHPFPSVSISADGRLVAFDGAGNNLVPGDTNGLADIFVRDRQLGTTERVSVDSAGVQGNGQSLYSNLSADGRFVAFLSESTNLVPGDTNSRDDVFVHDRVTGTTELVSLSTGGAQGDRESRYATISADGRYVAFESLASNFVLGDDLFSWDVFVRDRQLGTTDLVSVALGGVPAHSMSVFPGISADGGYVAFTSGSPSLVPGDTNGVDDIFLRDLQAGTTQRVSLSSWGAQGSFHSRGSGVSSDGRFVVFGSQAPNLEPGDTNGLPDVFVRDRALAITERVNISSAGFQANFGSADPGVQGISADGRFAAFSSHASTLVPGDTNGRSDIFVRDRGDGSMDGSFCFGDGTGAPCPCGNSGNLHHGCENSAGTGGALLSASGTSMLSADTLQLAASWERSTAFTILLQGTVIATTSFGDGLRCTGGAILRLYKRNAVGGAVVAPGVGELSISARSAALGHPIPLGAVRVYQFYYRDPTPTYCPSPLGGTFNSTNAFAAVWLP